MSALLKTTFNQLRAKVDLIVFRILNRAGLGRTKKAKVMLLEIIKNDKYLKPYFLWYLKCMLRMPHVVTFLQLKSPYGRACKREIVQDYNYSYKLLIGKLKTLDLDEEQADEVVVEVSRHYLNSINANEIIEGVPELLILEKHLEN